ncbi:PLD nuclease N-terminal domain-containing protein, partial [Micromonospora rosaria]|uniref:PLD nuclease N-terminal domain-containing protein n=1 Tax=Micromonospora rosaria TaxID=47874 RepID=UPI000835B871
MVRLLILLVFVQVVAAALALISCLSAEKGTVRALPRAAWVAVILLVPLVGWLAWFFAGRPLPAGRTTGWPGGASFRAAPAPAAPDDDPEFLRTIAERSRSPEHDLFRRWEEDLRDDAGQGRERDPRPGTPAGEAGRPGVPRGP